VTDPAPPPCEAPTLSDAAWDAIDSVLSDEERETFRAWLAQKDAEIAELRAILWHIATDPLQQAELREAVAAALAPKSSAGGGGD